MPNTPKMSDPRELFLHELGDLLFAERTIEKALPKLANEATNAELKRRRSSITSRRPRATSPTSRRSSTADRG